MVIAGRWRGQISIVVMAAAVLAGCGAKTGTPGADAGPDAAGDANPVGTADGGADAGGSPPDASAGDARTGDDGASDARAGDAQADEARGLSDAGDAPGDAAPPGDARSDATADAAPPADARSDAPADTVSLADAGSPDLGQAATCAPAAIWAAQFGDPGYQFGKAIAIDPRGGVVASGGFSGMIDLGGGAFSSTPNSDVFVARFDPAGRHLWSKRFGAYGSDVAADVAFDSQGAVVLTGTVQGSVDFGAGAVDGSANPGWPFIAKWDAGGNLVFGRAVLGGSTSPAGSGDALVVDGSDNVILAGAASGTQDFGGGPVATGGVFVVKYDARGNHVWSKGLGNPSTSLRVRGLAVDPSGNVFAACSLWGAASLGGDTLQSAGNADVALVKWSPGGQHLWSKRFGDSDPQEVWSLAVDAQGNVTIAGSFESGIDFGGPRPLVSVGSSDIFVASFDGNGQHRFSRRYGDAQFQSVSRVAAEPSGNILLVGTLVGGVDFGGGTLAAAGLGDVYVARFDPAGRHLCSQRFGDAQSQSGAGIAGNGGAMAFTGSNFGVVDFGRGPLQSAGSGDAYIAVLGVSPN